MNLLKRNKAYILILALNIIFICRLLRYTFNIQNFDYPYVLVMFFLSCGFYFVFNLLIKKRTFRVIFIILSLLVLGVYLYKSMMIDNILYKLAANISSIDQASITYAPTYFEQYKLMFLIFTPILSYIFLFLADVDLYNNVICITTALMITLWYIGFADQVKDYISEYIFVSVLTYAVNVITSTVKNVAKLDGAEPTGFSVILASVLIPSILVTCLVFALPKEFKGKFVSPVHNDLVNPYEAKIPKPNTNLKYALSISGYNGNETSLGGPLKINNSPVFKVNASYPMYLIGTIKNEYTGSAWKQNDSNYTKLSGDLNSVLKLADRMKQYNTKQDRVIIYPDGIKTSTYFAPLNSYDVANGAYRVFYNNIPSFLSDLEIKDEYSVDFYDNYDSDNPSASKRLTWYNDPIIDNNMPLSSYAEYLDVPGTITPRTVELTASITKGSASRAQIADKIKNYLKTTYPYDTNTSVVNQDDFLDYFLFTEKKGYCVYFATAMTVMCRLQGIPARYVEGFLMNDNKDSSGLYTVTNKDAHAWCQVLVDPVNNIWSNVEATPGFENQAENQMTPVISTAAETSTNIKIPAKPSSQTTPKTVNIKKSLAVKHNVYFYIIFILLMFVAKLIYNRIKFDKIIKSQSSLPLYKYCFKRLKSINIVRPDNLGDLEFSDKINDKELRNSIRRLIKAAYSEHYGSIADNQYNKLEIYSTVEEYIKNSENIIVYILKKYLIF